MNFTFKISWVYAIILASISSIAYSEPYPDFEKIVSKTRGSVVTIYITTKPKEPQRNPFQDDEVLREFFPPVYSSQQAVRENSLSGSGFFISKDGYIVTEYSVVSDAASVEVKLDNGQRHDAKIAGMDKDSNVGLIKIPGDQYVPLTPGDAGKLRAGQWVMAIGSPYGFENAVTVGVVSAVDTSVENSPGISFIMSNVAINQGNGGGPLINGRGEVVGMNAFIYSRTGHFSGLSFAVPIGDILFVIDQLKRNGKVTYSWLGVSTIDDSEGGASPRGVVVTQVFSQSPAQQAGLAQGDIITTIDGQTIKSSDHLLNIIRRQRPNTQINLEIIREGNKLTTSATLTTRPEDYDNRLE